MALLILPLLSLAHLTEASLQGLQYVVVGRLPETIIRPVAFIILLGGAYVILGAELSVYWVMGLNAIAVGIAFLATMYLLHKAMPQPVRNVSPVYQTRMWIGRAIPLMLISGIQIVNGRTDILMLGAIKGAEAVGIYNVACRGAHIVIFIQAAVNAALAPTIASLYAAGNMQRLQGVITKGTRVTLFVSLFFAIGLIVFGNELLSLFGADFIKGRSALVILIIGWVVNASVGPVGILLIMTGHERDAALGTGISAILNLVLNSTLIPRFGIAGAAASTATSMIVWNLLLMLLVYKRLGIYSTSLGRVSIRRKV
jgi:O-antigen/teichoic acid export membrane protein